MLSILVLSSLVAYSFAQSYCTSGPTTTVDSNLGAVTLQGDSSSISDDTNCPGFIGPKDLTALKADLSPGGSYKLTYTVTTCGNSFPTLAGAWIDYNQNFAFDTNELLGATFSTSKNAVEQQFVVPAAGADLVFGLTRLRVQVQETQATSLTPCASFPYGATKDFSIEIKSPGSGSGAGGMSGGVVFIIIVLVGGVLYAAIGCAYNKFAKGTTGAKETCPQGDFWFNLPANFIEGFRFTRRKLCGGGDYDKLGGGPAIDQNDL
jgi:hypothetical protein